MSLGRSVSRSLVPAALLAMLAGLVVTVFAAQRSLSEEARFDRGMRQVRIVSPATPPQITQEAINTALVMYDINVPATANFPMFDPELSDRGMTTMRGLGRKLDVTVGPSALASWPLLGSTLAHELEVHCRQNFTMIRMRDLAGFDGTGAAEREAYLHEVKNAARFGLSADDQQQIRYTMNFFYPVGHTDEGLAARLKQSVKSWLALNSSR